MVESRIALGAVTHFYVCSGTWGSVTCVCSISGSHSPSEDWGSRHEIRTTQICILFTPHALVFLPRGYDDAKGLFLPCIYAYRAMEILLLYSFSTVERFYWLFLTAKIIYAYCNMWGKKSTGHRSTSETSPLIFEGSPLSTYLYAHVCVFCHSISNMLITCTT